jgi:hypothetical protein
MSAVAVLAEPSRGTHPSPVIRSARLLLVAWPYAMIWPWGILALSFVVNLGIFAAVEAARADENGWTGGLMSIYVVQLIAYLQNFTRGLPFALGMSVTRRAYYFGTWLYAVLESFLFGAVLLVLRLVEDATNGWGVSLEYFGLGFLRSDNLLLQWLVYVVPFLLVASVGAFIGLLMARWSYNGLLTLIAVFIVLSGLAVVVISRQGWWGAIGSWFADQSATAMFAGWPLPVAAGLCLLGFLVIRRVTP